MGLQNTVPSYQSYNEEIHESCLPTSKEQECTIEHFYMH